MQTVLVIPAYSCLPHSQGISAAAYSDANAMHDVVETTDFLCMVHCGTAKSIQENLSAAAVKHNAP